MKDAFLIDFLVYALKQKENTLNESTRDDYRDKILNTAYLHNETEIEGHNLRTRYRTYLDDKWYRADIVLDYDKSVFSVENLCQEVVSSDGFLQLRQVE